MYDLLLLNLIALGCIALPLLSRHAASLGAQKYVHHIIFESRSKNAVPKKQSAAWKQAKILTIMFSIGLGITVYLLCRKGFIEPYQTPLISFLLGMLLLSIGRLLGIILVYRYVNKHPESVQGVTRFQYPLTMVIHICTVLMIYMPVIVVLGAFTHIPATAGFFGAASLLLVSEMYTTIYYQKLKTT